jgi:hypothetical protein
MFAGGKKDEDEHCTTMLANTTIYSSKGDHMPWANTSDHISEVGQPSHIIMAQRDRIASQGHRLGFDSEMVITCVIS